MIVTLLAASILSQPMPRSASDSVPTVIELVPASLSELAVPQMTFSCLDQRSSVQRKFRVFVGNDKTTSHFEAFQMFEGVRYQKLFSAPISTLAFSDTERHMLLKINAVDRAAGLEGEILIRVDGPQADTADFKLATSSIQYAARCEKLPELAVPPPPVRRERSQ